MLDRFVRFLMGFLLRENTPLELPGPFTQEVWDPQLLWRFNVAVTGTRVYFTSRPGGVSEPPYSSLNLAFHVGDDPAAVWQNRELVASILGIDPRRVTTPCQKHTAEIRLLRWQEEIGSGSQQEASCFDPCDGLVTSLPGAPLLLHFADCVPVVLSAAGKSGPAVAVIHAGRQGLMEGVVENGATVLIRNTGAQPADITAAIGPCIGPCCYEVDQSTAAEFAGRFPRRVDGRFLDLPQAASDALAQAGIWRENIYPLELCTSCDDNFFSYRRDGVTGRHGAIAWVE